MRIFAEVCESVSATTKKSEKTRLVAQYLQSHQNDESAIAALFFSGRPFPANRNLSLQVGGAMLGRAVIKLCNDETSLQAARVKHGDLGSAALDVLPLDASGSDSLSLADVQETFRKIAGTAGTTAKSLLVEGLLLRSTPLEAKYLLKLMSGDLRIGLRESLVEEAIARSYKADLDMVRRANMLLGDISETLLLAATGGLADAQHTLRLFKPIGMMLASPVDSAEEAAKYLASAIIEDKYDGIRAQVHSDGNKVMIFSRTLDDITSSFPDVAASILDLPSPFVIDGEIIGWEHETDLSCTSLDSQGRASAFSSLQTRIGRKKVTAEMIRRVPVAFVVFDVLYRTGELLIDRPLSDRLQILDGLFANKLTDARPPTSSFFYSAIQGRPRETLRLPPILRTNVRSADSAEELEKLFAAAQAVGNEGLMIKDLTSQYAAGRRGRAWLKMKKELATLDVVVTAVEYGHGKRAAVLSDYTFAVREGDRLLNIGKAYSGLTDKEIAGLTQWFLEHVRRDEGHRLLVEPSIVLEVAFNNIMKSSRHESGYALRFPRILRLRQDKNVTDIDTLGRAARILDLQRPPRQSETETPLSSTEKPGS